MAKNLRQKVPEGSSSGKIDDLENAIKKSNPEAFKNLPPEKGHEIIQATLEYSRTITGPIPPPESLEYYNKVIPNGADRIMKMAENQSAHRIRMEEKVIRSQLSQSNIGQFLAFFIGLLALLGAFYCIVAGHGWEGSFIGVGGVTGLVATFIQGKKQQNQDLQNKK